MTKQMAIVVIGSLRIKSMGFYPSHSMLSRIYIATHKDPQSFKALSGECTHFLGGNSVNIVSPSEKIRLEISCELSARQTIHMKSQALFSLKKKK